MPKYIQSAMQARMSDQNCIQEGVPSLVLMENAARQIASCLAEHFCAPYLFVCGPGNNGADGLAAARLLQNAGFQTTCIFEDTGHTSPEEKQQLQAALSNGVQILPYDTPGSVYENAGTLCDCLFGSGLSRPVTGIYATLIERMEQAGRPIVAVDIASGLDGNTGHILGKAVHARMTLALDTLKEGHIRNDGPACSGKVLACDIGIPDRYHIASTYVLDQEAAASLMPVRPDRCHKGDFGKVLLCGGSLQMQGALSLAARACFGAGCGTLTLYTPKSAAMAIASKMDIAMIVPAEETNGFFALDACVNIPELIRNYTCFGCGNGMGKGKGARLVVESLLESDIPLVLDADGINCIARRPELLKRKSATIITPHVKEFSRITGKSVPQILADPLQAARDFLAAYPDLVLVLKGAMTIVACKDAMYVLDAPNSALAKGGSGDVLAGLITGLLAWVDNPFHAAALGVYVHSASAAASAKSPIAFTPADLIEGFSDVFNTLSQAAM